MRINNEHQELVDNLKTKIKELQEIAEELEEVFPRLEGDDEKVVNSICRKLVDRLSSAHDQTIKLDIVLERVRTENER